MTLVFGRKQKRLSRFRSEVESAKRRKVLAAFALVLSVCLLISVSMFFINLRAQESTRAQIAFVSNRDGVNGDIFVMNADGSNPVNLTNTFGEQEQFPSWSPDGTKIAFDFHSRIHVMNADGTNIIQLTNHNKFGGIQPAWSPDGRKIAFLGEWEEWGGPDIYVMNADGTNPVQLTKHPAQDQEPAWSPDGRQIAFWSDRFGNWQARFATAKICVMDADGRGLPRRLTRGPGDEYSPSWSPDGQKIAFWSDRSGKGDIYVMNTDGSNVTNLTNHPASDLYPAWSPDGSQIAFTSDRDSDNPDINSDIYVMDADGDNPRNLTNRPGGSDWDSTWFHPAAYSVSPTGKRLLIWGWLKQRGHHHYRNFYRGNNLLDKIESR